MDHASGFVLFHILHLIKDGGYFGQPCTVLIFFISSLCQFNLVEGYK